MTAIESSRSLDDGLLYDAASDLETMQDLFARLMVSRADGWEIAQAHHFISSALSWLLRLDAVHPRPTAHITAQTAQEATV